MAPLCSLMGAAPGLRELNLPGLASPPGPSGSSRAKLLRAESAAKQVSREPTPPGPQVSAQLSVDAVGSHTRRNNKAFPSVSPRPSAGLRCGIFGHRLAPSAALRSRPLPRSLAPLPPSGLARRGRLSNACERAGPQRARTTRRVQWLPSTEKGFTSSAKSLSVT